MSQMKYKGALFVTYGAMLFEGALNAVLVAAMIMLAQHFQKDVSDISVLVSLKGLGTLVSLYFSGRLSDRYGRKVVILAGLVCFSVFVFGMLATNIYALAMVFALFSGIGHGLMDAPAMSILFDVFGNKTGPAMSMVQVFFSGGGVLTSLTASILITRGWPWQYLFYGYAVMALLLCFVIVRSVYPSIAKLSGSGVHRIVFQKKPTVWKEGLILGCCAALLSVINAINSTWLPTFGIAVKGLNEGAAIRLLTFYQIGAVCGSFLFAYMLRKIHTSVLMVLNPLLGAVMLFLAITLGHPLLVYFFIFMTGMMMGVYFSLCINMGGELFYESAGSATGAIGTITMGGSTLMVMITGKLLPIVGTTNLFFVSAIVMMLLGVMAFYFRTLYKACMPAAGGEQGND